jgi:hypothetical protein
MKQYCVYTRDPQFRNVIKWLTANQVLAEVHINRTRFWVPEGILMTEFLLKWYDVCPSVAESDDYVCPSLAESDDYATL